METIGSYRILSQIGAGGMGAVFLAEHRFLKRRSAIKMLLADLATRPDVLERFFSEARATSQLEHPGIVRIFDCEIDAHGRPYFVMEYLEGETLGAYLRRHGRLPFAEAAGYAAALADALGAAHERGIVHRDLKPDNVFVRPGPVPAIKLVDFGIAKLAEEFRAVAGSRTQTGTLLGTPPYMSPEQCKGAGTIDHRTDIYSLGCVLFETLCGLPPFERDSTGGFLIAHITETPPLASEKNPEVPAELGAIVARMLAKSPADRPQSMREVIDALLPFVPIAPYAGTPFSGSVRHLPPPAAPLPVTAPVPALAPPRSEPGAAATVAATAPRTTLQSNAGELVDAGGPVDDGGPRGGKRKVLVLGGALALAAIGFTAWKLLPPAAPPPTVVASDETPPAPPTPVPLATEAGRKGKAGGARTAAKPDGKVDKANVRAPAPPVETAPVRNPAAVNRPGSAAVGAARPATPARAPSPPAAAPAGSAAGGGSASARARGFVIVDIDSEPTGALICFEGDPRIISATRRALQLPYADQQVTFLIDLPGYEPGRFTLRGNRDARKVVKLRPMPPGQGRRPVCSY